MGLVQGILFTTALCVPTIFIYDTFMCDAHDTVIHLGNHFPNRIFVWSSHFYVIDPYFLQNVINHSYLNFNMCFEITFFPPWTLMYINTYGSFYLRFVNIWCYYLVCISNNMLRICSEYRSRTPSINRYFGQKSVSNGIPDSTPPQCIIGYDNQGSTDSITLSKIYCGG